MAAGDSAAQEAKRAQMSADQLERRAGAARRRSNAFAAGAIGEQAVAEEIERLSESGWAALHDRQLRGRSNIDHLLIGPAGVAVVDAKNWSAPVRVEGDRLFVDGRASDGPEQVRRQVDAVRRALEESGREDVAVRGFVVLTGPAQEDRERVDLGEVRLLGVRRMASVLGRRQGPLNSDEVSELTVILARAFPDALAEAPGSAEIARAGAPSRQFLAWHRVFYIRQWSGHGRVRFYMRDQNGVQLGWKDKASGQIAVVDDGPDSCFVRPVLVGTTSSGVVVDVRSLPRVPVKVFGTRMLSRLGRLYLSVLVGQEYRRGQVHRLYGTLLDPVETSYTLGHVDLVTKTLHPTSKGALSKTRRSGAEDYLRNLRDLREQPGLTEPSTP